MQVIDYAFDCQLLIKDSLTFSFCIFHFGLKEFEICNSIIITFQIVKNVSIKNNSFAQCHLQEMIPSKSRA